MKRSQIILFVVFLVITGLIYFALASNKKEFNKELKTEDTVVHVPVRKVANTLKSLTLTSYGQVLPYAEVIVSMEVQGKLERGNITMKPGVNFRTGDILYKVNNEEAFYSLSSRKSALSNLVLNAMPDIEMDFPSEKDKWLQFMSDLDPARRLPELPRMSSKKEQRFMTGKTIIAEYYNLKSQEARMEKYFYVAPFNGTVIETYAEPGAIANPGAQLAKIAKTGDFEVKVPIAMQDLQQYRDKSTAQFTDAAGKHIANGSIIRVSDMINKQTQSADVYYSIKAIDGNQIYNGMYLNVTINQKDERESMTLPRAAVKDGKATVLAQNKLTEVPVVIISAVPDSVFVTGLNDGQMVLLERADNIDNKITYKGIER